MGKAARAATIVTLALIFVDARSAVSAIAIDTAVFSNPNAIDTAVFSNPNYPACCTKAFPNQPCFFRIPVVIAPAPSVVLAFAEQRGGAAQWGCSDGAGPGIAMKRSTARRSSAEHLIATKAPCCTATAWILTVAQCSAIP